MTTISKVGTGGRVRLDDDGRAVHSYTKCGHCGRIWDDAIVTGSTPAPSGRCPFEYEHKHPQSTAERRRVATNHLPDGRWFGPAAARLNSRGNSRTKGRTANREARRRGLR